MDPRAPVVYAHAMTRTTSPSRYVFAALCTLVACGLTAAGAQATASSSPATKAVVVRAAAPGSDGTAALDAGFDFNMLGALLRLDRPRDARPRLAVRVSADSVAWGPWRALVLASAEGRAASAGRARATASEPLWVGDACYVQYRLTVGGRPATRRTITRLRFAFINSMGHDAADALPATMTSFAALAGAATAGRSTTVADFPLAPRATSSRPAIVTRAGWGADGSWRHQRLRYARVRMAFVHHTAGATEYTPEQAPAIVRAIAYYHAKVLGWGDIGYNFLIDKYGTIYQGHRGSMRRGVVGAQTLGFNAHSTGISLMGTFGTSEPTPAMLASLERLLAWKLSLTGVGPLGHATMRSGGSGKFAPGVRVRFNAVSGHRDACFTDCPGNALYARLTQVRRSTAALVHHRPMPLYVSAYASPQTITPNGDGVDDGATISCYAYSGATIRVAVCDGSGAELRLLQDWTTVPTGIWAVTWDGALAADGGPVAASGAYTVRVDATDAYGHTTTAGTKVVVNVTVSGVSVKPAWFSPNGDGVKDATTIAYTLDKDATPVVIIGPVAAPIRRFSPSRQVAGTYQVTWDGLDASGNAAPDGRYPVTVRATDDTGRATVARSVAIDRIAPKPIATKPWLTVKANARLDVPYLVRDRSARTVRARIRVTDALGTVVRDSDRGWVPTGRARTIVFRDPTPGVYHLSVTAYDLAGNHEKAPAVIEVRVK